MTDALRRLALAIYALALYHVLSPVLDIATSVWPFNFGDERWRYSLAGYASNYMVSAIFGMGLAAVVAAACGHRTMLRIVGALSGLAAAGLLLMILSLGLDALQLNRLVDRESASMFRIGVGKAGLKFACEATVTALLAIGSFRAAKVLASERPAAPLVR